MHKNLQNLTPHRRALRADGAGLSGRTLRAERRTGAQHIALSERDSRLVEVTLAGLFLAEPDDICTLNLPKLGLTGDFTVRSVRSSLDEGGAKCTITMGGT